MYVTLEKGAGGRLAIELGEYKGEINLVCKLIISFFYSTPICHETHG